MKEFIVLISLGCALIFRVEAQVNQQEIFSATISPKSIFSWKGLQKYGLELDIDLWNSQGLGTPTSLDKVQVKMFTSWATNITAPLIPVSGRPNTYKYQDGMLYSCTGLMAEADGGFKTLEDGWTVEEKNCVKPGVLWGCWDYWKLYNKSTSFENFVISYIKDESDKWGLFAFSLDVQVVITTYGKVNLDHIKRVTVPGASISQSQIKSGGKSTLFESSFLAAPDREIIFGERRDNSQSLDPTSYSSIMQVNNPYYLPIEHNISDPAIGWRWAKHNFHEFEASYSNGQSAVTFYISSIEWNNYQEARSVAEKYAKALGRVPEVLRDFSSHDKKFEIAVMKNFNNNWSVYPGAVPETSGKVFQILIDDAQTESINLNDGKLMEEMFMHELSHILHERVSNPNNYDNNWQDAVNNDIYWLSDYALENDGTNNPEDHSETFPIWLLYKYKKDRMYNPQLVAKGLKHRFEYYENHFKCSRIRPWSGGPLPGCTEFRVGEETDVVETLNSRNNNYPLKAYPNPSSGAIHLDFQMLEQGLVNYRVMDLSGKDVLSKQLTLPRGDQSLIINEHYALRSGVYMIELIAPGLKETRRVLVE